MTDLELVMAEIEETATDLDDMDLSAGFHEQLDRIRLDMKISPFITLTENMCKWVVLAYKRDTVLKGIEE